MRKLSENTKITLTLSQLKSLVKEELYPNPDPHYAGLQVAFDDLYEALGDAQAQTDAINSIEGLPVEDGTDEEYKEILETQVVPYVNNLKDKLDALLKKVGGGVK